MIKHLTKHGNSLALVIEKPVLELLNISDTTPLQVVTDGKRLIIEPVKGSRLNVWLRSEHKRHGSVYKRLSSSK